jgi:phage shock protein PspC (stress-responsive transcriptional regulator)
MMTRTLYRSRTDRMLLGVCGGLGAYWGIDPTVVRVLAVLLAWMSAGAAFIVYFVLAVLVPEEPAMPQGTASYAWPQSAATGGGDAAMTDDNVGDTTPQPGTEPQPAPPEPTPPPAEAPAPPPVQPPSYVAPPPAAPPQWEQPASTPERHRTSGGITGGVILIVVGLLFLAEQFIPGLNVWRFWPVILIVIGLSIILRRR